MTDKIGGVKAKMTTKQTIEVQIRGDHGATIGQVQAAANQVAALSSTDASLVISIVSAIISKRVDDAVYLKNLKGTAVTAKAVVTPIPA